MCFTFASLVSWFVEGVAANTSVTQMCPLESGLQPAAVLNGITSLCLWNSFLGLGDCAAVSWEEGTAVSEAGWEGQSLCLACKRSQVQPPADLVKRTRQ